MEQCLRCGGSADESSEALGESCTSCGAKLTGAVDWCTLCLAPVRQAEPAVATATATGLSNAPLPAWATSANERAVEPWPGSLAPTYQDYEPPEVKRNVRYATFGQRYKAELWDIVLMCVLYPATFMIVGVVIPPVVTIGAWGWILFVFYNRLVRPCLTGQTFGKSRVGIFVEVAETHKHPGFFRNLLREAIKFIGPLYFVALFHPKKKHLGDIICGTVVVT